VIGLNQALAGARLARSKADVRRYGCGTACSCNLGSRFAPARARIGKHDVQLRICVLVTEHGARRSRGRVLRGSAATPPASLTLSSPIL